MTLDEMRLEVSTRTRFQRYTSDFISALGKFCVEMSGRQLAKAIGVDHHIVNDLVKRYRLGKGINPIKRRIPDKVNTIKKLHAEGLDIAEISKRMGGYRTTYIRRILHTLGLQTDEAFIRNQHLNKLTEKFRVACGWPKKWKLRLRQMQIMNLLAEGPMTTDNLARRIEVSTAVAGKYLLCLRAAGFASQIEVEGQMLHVLTPIVVAHLEEMEKQRC